jgi:hypothetical protein
MIIMKRKRNEKRRALIYIYTFNILGDILLLSFTYTRKKKKRVHHGM